jgi:hypothetical protein
MADNADEQSTLSLLRARMNKAKPCTASVRFQKCRGTHAWGFGKKKKSG